MEQDTNEHKYDNFDQPSSVVDAAVQSSKVKSVERNDSRIVSYLYNTFKLEDNTSASAEKELFGIVQQTVAGREVLQQKINARNHFIEVARKSHFHLELPKIAGDSKLRCKMGGREFWLAPGVYVIVGTMESGKSTLLRNLSQKEVVFMCNESYVNEKEMNSKKALYANNFSVTDNLFELEYYLNDRFKNGQVAFVDSIRCILSLNESGYAKGGVPIGPFDFIDALDKYCRAYQQLAVCVLPVDEESMEVRERFYSMSAIRCSGAFMPFALQNTLAVRIRYDLLAKSRISRLNLSLYETENISL